MGVCVVAGTGVCVAAGLAVTVGAGVAEKGATGVTTGPHPAKRPVSAANLRNSRRVMLRRKVFSF